MTDKRKAFAYLAQVQAGTLLGVSLLGGTMSRRKFGKLGLVGLAGLLETGALVKSLFNPTTTQATSNPIVVENQLAGSTGWQLDLWSTDKYMEITGYASAVSVNKGESVDLHVSVHLHNANHSKNYFIDVYRMGWYGGMGGRKMMPTAGPFVGVYHAAPAPNLNGTVECNWPVIYTLTTGSDWTTGCYLVKLSNSENYQSYIPLVVRDDSSQSAILFQSSVNTLQAYNGWGGKSLYSYNSTSKKPAVKVSFDRPYDGGGASDFIYWELSLLRFIEQNGYDVSYISDLDTHLNAGQLLNHKAFVSVGHNEYWTRPMYDGVLAARTAGRHLAFFGANAVYWQVRYEASSTNVANRIVVGYKEQFTSDPLYGNNNALVTGRWRDAPINRPENNLVGVMFDSYKDGDVGQPYIVNNSTHWVYAGTGFNNGDTVNGIVGYEWDKVFTNIGRTPPGLVKLSSSPVKDNSNISSVANSSIYRMPGGGWIFSTGSIYWCYGCDFNAALQTTNLTDARIQRTTKNVLDKFVAASSGYSTFSLARTATLNQAQQELAGRWHFSAVSNDGSIMDGFLVLQNDLSGKLILNDAVGGTVTAVRSGSTLMLALPKLGTQAIGQLQGSDIVVGSFSESSGKSGKWVAGRGQQRITSVKGRYNFKVKTTAGAVPNLDLSGVITLQQETITLPSKANVLPLINSQIEAGSTGLKVKGVANAGEIYLTFKYGVHTFLGNDAKVSAQGDLSGTLYDFSGQRVGEWQMLLVPERPNLARKWKLKAQTANQQEGLTLKGTLEWTQDPQGHLSGIFTPADSTTAQTANGTVSEQGQVAFKTGNTDFVGKFDLVLEKYVNGTFYNHDSGETGNWGIK